MEDYRKCFLCERSETSYNRLEVHHLFGAANRKKSDKLGLTVTLCHNCHNEPPFGVHHNADTMDYLHKYGQKKCMSEQGWTKERFTAEFGRNYLD